MRISDCISDVCSSDLLARLGYRRHQLFSSPRPPSQGSRASDGTAAHDDWCHPTTPPGRAAPGRRRRRRGCRGREKIGRAHVSTPVTNAHLVCRLLLEKKKNTTNNLKQCNHTYHTQQYNMKQQPQHTTT